MKRMIAGFLIGIFASVVNADPVAGTLTFTVTQKPAANGLVIPQLTWATDPNADRCVASGDWTGSRNPDRTSPLELPAIAPPKTYKMTCGWDDKDVVLSWVPPTVNTNGSPLTNLKGYKIYYGNNLTLPNDATTTIIDIPDATVRTRTIAPLAPGVYYFAMTAYNSATPVGESARTATVQATLGTAEQAVTRSIEATILVPGPPTGVTAIP